MGMQRGEPRMSQPMDAAWNRWDRTLSDWVPYVTLGASLLLSLIPTGEAQANPLRTAVLAVCAALWVYYLYTRLPNPRQNYQGRIRFYFVGFVLFSSLLMAHHAFFFIFAITGFFHASLLRPWWVAFLGVGAVSTAIHTIITGFPWLTVESWIIFPSIIVIQTLAIGFGMVIAEKVAEISEQRRQAVARLVAALEENAGLHAQLLTQAREAGVRDERQRLAREIHDTITQGLIGIITQLEAAQQVKGQATTWQRYLSNAGRLARESLSEARRSVTASLPESLESASLPEALSQVTQQWTVVNGVPVKVVVTGDTEPLHPEIELALLRTAQEALANVARHAQASRVGVTLSYMGDVVTLDVRDDGCGFVVVSQPVGFGLTTMRQRVSRVAGTLIIESEPGGGTAVSARIPAIPAQQEVLT